MIMKHVNSADDKNTDSKKMYKKTRVTEIL